jgi:hypothetical protein
MTILAQRILAESEHEVAFCMYWEAKTSKTIADPDKGHPLVNAIRHILSGEHLLIESKEDGECFMDPARV